MVVDFHNNFIFQHIFKTGGTTIKNALYNSRHPDQDILNKWSEDKTYKAYDNSLCFEFGNEHITFDQFNVIWPKIDFKNYYKFCFIRHTYDWIVAGYKHCCDVSYFSNYPDDIKMSKANEFTFEFYVKNWLMPDNTQLDFMTFNGKMHMDFVGRFEDLQNDYNKVCTTVGIPRKDLSKLNSSEGRNYILPSMEQKAKQHYSLWFTDELLEMVNQKYKQEIDYFNFKFEDKR